MLTRILKHPFLTVFCFAVITHVLIFALLYSQGFQQRAMTDGSQYKLLAQNVLDGHGFSESAQAPYAPDAIRTPGYPLYLAASKAVTNSFEPSLFVSVILGATIPLAGMALLMLLGRTNRREWLIMGCLLALEPHLFYYSLIYGSEALFLPLVAWSVVAAVALLNRPSLRFGILTGVLFGLAVLVRPIVQFFPYLLAIALLIRWRRAAIKPAIALVLGYLLLVSPWILWNVRHHGVRDFSNIGWFNMYTRVAATTEAIATRRAYNPVRIEYLQRLHEKGYIEKSPVEEIDVHGYEWKRIFQEETLRTIQRYPREFAVSQVSSFFTIISQDLSMEYLRKMGLLTYSPPRFSPFVVLFQSGLLATVKAVWGIISVPIVVLFLGRILWLVVFVLSLWSLVVTWKRDRKVFPLVLLLVIYELQIIALSLNAAAQSDARYRAQFSFAEIPLAWVAFVGIMRSRASVPTKNNPACPVCESRSEIRSWGMKRAYHLYRCELCRVRFVFPLPTSEELAAFYSDSYFFGGGSHGGYVDYDADKRAARESLLSFLQKLEHEVPEKGSLLDVGAATGSFLEVAKERGWKVSGHEISQDAAERARKKGITMTTGELSTAGYSANSFSAITSLDVIEHVPNPERALREMADLLRPDGAILLNTPDSGSWYARLMGIRWHAYNPPEHLTIFDRRSLSLLVERAGLEVAWVGKVKKSFRVSYILHTLSHWTRLRFFSRLAAVIERKPSLNWAIPLNLRDNIVLIARKRV
ncbi:methyltransferase domain-containing protein [Patescibacteria group bacterium]|nr:methyltransferase domain-containing protein [Patescibacteria group bacterium]